MSDRLKGNVFKIVRLNITEAPVEELCKNCARSEDVGRKDFPMLMCRFAKHASLSAEYMRMSE